MGITCQQFVSRCRKIVLHRQPESAVITKPEKTNRLTTIQQHFTDRFCTVHQLSTIDVTSYVNEDFDVELRTIDLRQPANNITAKS